MRAWLCTKAAEGAQPVSGYDTPHARDQTTSIEVVALLGVMHDGACADAGGGRAAVAEKGVRSGGRWPAGGRGGRLRVRAAGGVPAGRSPQPLWPPARRRLLRRGRRAAARGAPGGPRAARIYALPSPGQLTA